MTENVRRRSQPEYTLDFTMQPAYKPLNPLDRWFASNAADYLEESSRRGLISLRNAIRIVQFGASEGHETIALVELARQNGGSVIALEIDNERGKTLRKSRILPPKQIFIEDGIKYLERMAVHGETCDLLAAFFLDFNDPEVLIGRLLPAAQAVLPEGQLLITSDIDPMMVTRSVLDEQGISYTTFKAGTEITATAAGMLTRGKAGGAFDRPAITIYDPEGTQQFGTKSFFKHTGLVTSFKKK